MEAWISIAEGAHGKGERAEQFVANHLVVSIFGAYQTVIRGAIVQRAVRTGDAGLGQFMENMLKKMSMTKTDLKHNILTVLAGINASDLDRRVSGEAFCAYECMRRQRNTAAHGGHADIGLQKIRDLHDIAKTVVCEIERAILTKERHPYEMARTGKQANRRQD